MFDPKNWFWQVGDDATRLWSSAAAAYVAVDSGAAVDWMRGGRTPTRIASEDELWAILERVYPRGLPAARGWYVPIPLVRQRLEAAGLWSTLASALIQQPAAMLKVLSLEQGVLSTDAEARGLLQAIGADVDAILAPP